MTAASRPLPASAGDRPLLSARWYRLAAVRPALAAAVRVQRIVYRGTPWCVLEHADSLRSFRLNAAAYAFVGRFNGQRSLQSLWELLLAEQADDAPTQDELLQLLLQLQDGGRLKVSLCSLQMRIQSLSPCKLISKDLCLAQGHGHRRHAADKGKKVGQCAPLVLFQLVMT